MNKILKRTVPLLLLCVLFLSGVTVHGKETSLENMLLSKISLVEERLMLPKDYKVSSYSITGDGIDTADARFLLVWSYDGDPKNQIDVSIVNDFIISYYKSNLQSTDNYEEEKSSINAEVSKSKIVEWLKNVNPDNYENIIIIKSDYIDHYYDLEYSKEGIPVYGINGIIGVSKKNGEVEIYKLPYVDTSNYPTSTNIISEDEAIKIYGNKIGIKPIYKTYLDENGKAEGIIVYVEDKKGYAIDAINGNEIKVENEISPLIAEYSEFESSNYILPERDMVEFENFYGENSIISLEDATNNILKNEIINLPENIEIVSANLYKQYLSEEKYFLSFFLRNKTDKDYNYYSLTLDANTGEITQYNKSYPYSNKKLEEDISVYRKKADEAFKSLAGNKSKEFVFDTNYNKDLNLIKSNTISFNYKRVVNGIYFPENNYTITLNSENELVNYNGVYSEIPFQSTDNMISKTEALENLFKVQKLNRYYLPKENKSEATIMYKLENPNYIINSKTDNIETR